MNNSIGERLLKERVYLMPHRPAPGPRRAILWSARTPRPLPVVFSVKEKLVEVMPDGDTKAWYDAKEFSDALVMWQAGGVRCDVAAIVAEVFGNA